MIPCCRCMLLSPWLLVLLFSSFTASETDPSDAAVLQSFLKGLTNPQLLSWTGDDPCGGNWPHLQCEGSHVTALAMAGLGLQGTLPLNLNQLSNLRYLGLQDNSFHGALPSLTGLALLQTAYLNNNNFDTIPGNFFSGLVSLTAIYLDHSNLNATNGWLLPSDILESTNLMNLSLTNTSLSGTIPSFLGSMANLRVLNLAYNRLGGGIPPSFQNSNIVQLQINNMAGPVLTGPIDVLGSMASLTELWVQVNQIEGIIPVGMSNAVSLQNLKINDNKITGPIPSNFTNLPLIIFTFDNNQLIGSIPEFSSDVNITFFGNNFCQPTVGAECAPEVNALLSFLGVVDFPSGIVSSWTGNDPCSGWIGIACESTGHVSVINLASYNLSGVISPSLANLTYLSILKLSDNLLTGTIPASLIGLKLLRLLDLSNNNLSGTPPTFSPSTTVQYQGNPMLLQTLVPAPSHPPSNPQASPSPSLPTVSPAPFSPPAQVPHTGIPLPPPSLAPGVPVSVPVPPPAISVPSPIILSPVPVTNPSLPIYAPQLSVVPVTHSPLAARDAPMSGKVTPGSVLPKSTSPPFANKTKIVANASQTEQASTPLTSNKPVSQNQKSSSQPVPILVGSIAGVLILSVVVFALYFVYKRKYGPHPRISSQNAIVYHQDSASDPDMVKEKVAGSIFISDGRSNESTGLSGSSELQGIEGGKLEISIQALRHATKNFSGESIIGKGGFGVVYKGVMEDGTIVAVKRMVATVVNSKGPNEFSAEIEVLTKVRHRNLVTLLGYCIDGFEKLLVYEYMPNGNLSQHLFDKGKVGWTPLDWNQRVSIALDVAHGMEYLHLLAHKSFIHRDLKPSNVLLDDKFRAKVSDFGLVKHAPEGKQSIETKLAGTFGYLAPEYAVTGRITTKADVFSFGVVLMELITGRRALDQTEAEENVHLVAWFRRNSFSEEYFRGLIDPLLDVPEGAFESMLTVAELAGHCTAQQPYQRPDMGHIVNKLAPLVGQWKPINMDAEITTGIDLSIPLEQALKKWQDMEDSCVLSFPEDSQRAR